MAAERLHLVDVGHLEGQQDQHGHAGDGGEVLPFHAILRHHVADIDQHADQCDQRNLDHADGAGEHNRRYRRHHRFSRGHRGGFREAMRRGPRGGRPGRCVDHAACIELRHRRMSVCGALELPPFVQVQRCKVVKKVQKTVSATMQTRPRFWRRSRRGNRPARPRPWRLVRTSG